MPRAKTLSDMLDFFFFFNMIVMMSAVSDAGKFELTD